MTADTKEANTVQIGLREWMGVAVFTLLHGAAVMGVLWRWTIANEKRITILETRQASVLEETKTNQQAIMQLLRESK